MAAAEHFDVVVVGRSLAGLLTAALLARRKFRVRVVDCADAPPLERPPLFGDTARLVGRVLDELGLQHSLRTRLEGPWRPVTVALPDRRFVFATEDADRGRELAEALPGRVDALVALFARIEALAPSLDALLDGDLALPEAGWRARRAWQRAVDGLAAAQLAAGVPWTADPMVRLLLRALLRVAGQADDASGPMTARGVRALWHLMHGVVPIKDGRAGFARMVAEKLDVLGGDVDARRKAGRLVVRRKKAEAIETTDGGRVGADVVVLAGGAPDLARLWPEAPAPASRPGRRMRLLAPASERPVDLRDPCGWIPSAEGPAHLVRVSDERLVLSWLGESTPPLAGLLPFGRVEAVETIAVPHPVEAEADPLALTLHPLSTPLRNVLYVGEWVLPGLGLEGACFTAWHAAARVERIGPRRRRG